MTLEEAFPLVTQGGCIVGWTCHPDHICNLERPHPAGECPLGVLGFTAEQVAPLGTQGDIEHLRALKLTAYVGANR